jgi:probable phosphoglycerate mutase
VPTLAVTHRGVIRALLAEATGWDMRGKPPAKLDWEAAHLFVLDAHGKPSVERLNVR